MSDLNELISGLNSLKTAGNAASKTSSDDLDYLNLNLGDAIDPKTSSEFNRSLAGMNFDLGLDSASADDLPSFKMPAAGADLPSFKMPSADADLPSFKMPAADADLPSFKMPSADADLPSFKLPNPGADLPSFKMPAAGGDLPSLKAPGAGKVPSLKKPAGNDLPSFKMPSAAAGGDLPSFKNAGDTGLPSLKSSMGGDDPLGLMSGGMDNFGAMSDLMADPALDSGFPMPKNNAEPGMSMGDLFDPALAQKSLISDGRGTGNSSTVLAPAKNMAGGRLLNSAKVSLVPTGMDLPPVKNDLPETKNIDDAMERAPRRQTCAFNPMMGFDDGSASSLKPIQDSLKPPSQERAAVPVNPGATTAQYGDVPGQQLFNSGITQERNAVIAGPSTSGVTQQRMPAAQMLEKSGRAGDSQRLEAPKIRLGAAPEGGDPLGLMGESDSKESSSSGWANKMNLPDFSSAEVSNGLAMATIPAREGVGDLVNAYAGKAPQGGGEVTEAVDDEEAGELVFDLNSIKSDKLSSETKSAANVKDKKAKRRKKGPLIACGCIAAALLCGGAAFYNHLQNEKEEQLLNTPVVVQEEHIELSFGLVRSDRLGGYTAFYRTALEKLKQNSIADKEREDAQGQVLVAVTLAMTRYGKAFKDDLAMLDASAAKIAESCQGNWCALGLWSWGLLRNNEKLVADFAGKISRNDAVIQNVIQVAVKYAAWNPENETYNEMIDSGQGILKLIRDDVKDWPLLHWIKASTLRRIGLADEALKLVSEINGNTEISFASLLIEEAEMRVELDQFDEANALCERLMKLPSAEPDDKKKIQRLLFQIKASTSSWDTFENELLTYLRDNAQNPDEIETAAKACLQVNKADRCHTLFQLQLDAAPQNLALRDAYIRILVVELGLNNLIRPDQVISGAALLPLQTAVDDGIAKTPDGDLDLWKSKLLLGFAQGDNESAEKAMDEVERGQKLVWLGAFIREIMPYAAASDAKKESIRSSLREYSKSVSSIENMLALAYTLEYVQDTESARLVLARAYKHFYGNTAVLNAYFDLAVQLKDRELSQKLFLQLEKRGALTLRHEFAFARLLESIGEANTALERMLVLLARDADKPNAELLSYVGELFLKQDRCDSALPYFVQSIEVDPNKDQTHYFKGLCLYKSGKFDDALLEFNEAATQNDSNRIYDLWIGMALAGLSHISEAQRAFTAVIDDYTGKSDNAMNVMPVDDPTAAEAYFFRAEIRKLQNKRADAKSDYQEALALSADNIRYLSGYAVFLYESVEVEECIKTVDRIQALSENGIDSVLYFIRGLSKLKLDKRADALKDLELARDHGFAEREDSGVIGVREPVEIYERIGFLYRDMGRKEEAKSALRFYLELSKTLSQNARKDLQSEIDKI